MSSLSDLLPDLERVVWDVAERRFGALARAQARLVDAIREMSFAYNDEEGSGVIPNEPIHRLARLVFFTVADLSKITFPLAELGAARALGDGPLHVRDVGAGFGAQSLGLVSSLAVAGHPGPIEPALRTTTREFHRIRDHLLRSGQATVFAPCTRAGPVRCSPSSVIGATRPAAGDHRLGSSLWRRAVGSGRGASRSPTSR